MDDLPVIGGQSQRPWPRKRQKQAQVARAEKSTSAVERGGGGDVARGERETDDGRVGRDGGVLGCTFYRGRARERLIGDDGRA